LPVVLADSPWLGAGHFSLCALMRLPDVIEHLSASLRDEGGANDSQAAKLRDRWVAQMVRFGAVPILIATLLMMLHSYDTVGLRWSWGGVCVLFDLGLSVTCLSLTFTKWFTRHWRPLSLLLLTALIVSNTGIDTLGNEPLPVYIMLLLLMVGTGSILPWPQRYQLILILVSLSSWAIENEWVPTIDGTLLYRIAGLLTAAALSWFTCYVRDRFVREHEEADRIVGESERTLRRMFDANTDSIVLTDMETQRIVDVNESCILATGYSREEVLGKTSDELAVWADPAIKAEHRRRLREHHQSQNMEVNFRLKDGSIKPHLLSSVIVTVRGRPSVMTLARDVTDLRKSQEELRESEEKFRLIFQASRDAILLTRVSDLKIIEVNEHFARLSGFGRDDMLGRTAGELGLWAIPEQRTKYMETLLKLGYVDSYEMSLRTRSGDIVPMLIAVGTVKVAGEDSYLAVARDISRIREEQEIRDSATTLRKIFDASADWMSIVEMATGDYLDVNESFIDATGYTREEIIGSNFWKLGLWPVDEQWQSFTEELVFKGEVRNRRVTLRNKAGRLIPALISAVRCELWGKLCSIVTGRDISELNGAEQKLRQSETTMRAMFDASLDNLALVDLTDQTLLEVNREFTKTIGYSREEVIGKRFYDLVPSVDPAREQEYFATLMQGHELRNFEMNMATRGGRTFPALVSSAIIELDGRTCSLSAARDISELVKAREAALAASRAKSEFVSIMSHEIRTPMNAILGMTDLMGESELNSEQRRYLDTILSNSNALLDLINSILDLAKVESGRLSLENIEFDLLELSEHAADTLAVRAHEKGVELAVRFPTDLAPMVMGDPYRLRQVLNNLIGNAIKFTRAGEVVVSLDRNRDARIPGNFVFTVRDTGIGIAPDKIDSIFSAFTQADTSTTRNFGGSGLGLAIVERLVGLMGGEVRVESEVGKGSTFSFTVDLRIPHTSCAQAPPPTRLELSGARTLMLVDNATTRAVVAEMLRAQGAEVVETASSVEALAAIAAETRDASSFRLLLIDAELRSSDAYDALRPLRAGSPHAAVVLLTNSNGLPGKLRRMREHSVGHYLTKPIKRHELYAVVAEALSKSGATKTIAEAPRLAPASTIAPATAAHAPLKILLADDSPDNRLLIRAYIKNTPYVITEAEDGQIAVDRFINGAYDLVLMDIQMPVLDGYSAVRAIRKWESEKGQPRTPIIALTASALDEDVRRAKEAGCDMHVSKPVKKSTLLESITSAVESVRCEPTEPAVVAPAVVPGVTVIAHPAAPISATPLPTFEI
jgi:PAS domain S-box-containing protein